MSESKHTRGPWRSQGWVATWAYIPIHDARHNLVASMYPDMGHGYTRDEVEANARLIAAAPETKDALRKLVNEVTGLAGFGPEIKALIGVTNWNVLEQRVQEARQALAKAEASR